MIKICDVLIVGAGPAGLSVASNLPSNVSVVVVHQDKEIGKPVRTSGGSWLSDMKALSIPPNLYSIMDKIDFFSDQKFHSFKMIRHKPVVLNITELYQYLKTLCKNNVSFHTNSKFIETRLNENGSYISSVRNSDKKITKIESKYIVDASGYQRAVAVQTKSTKKCDRMGIGIEYEYDIGTNDPSRAILFVGSKASPGYGWIFPAPNNKLRIGIGIIHPDSKTSPKTLIEEFLSSADPQKYGIDVSGPFTVNAGIVPSEAYSKRLIYGKIILVGDSARVATPTVGEGIRISIECGRKLGNILGHSINHKDERYLLNYESYCNKLFVKNYFVGQAVNKIIAKFSPTQWDRAINNLKFMNEDQIHELLKSKFGIISTINLISRLIKNRILS